MRLNLANHMTLARIYVIPFICLFMSLNAIWASWVAIVLFVIAAVTDFFDGYVARNYDQLSTFGRVLDPIADKLLVAAVLLMIAITDRLNDINFLPAIVILLREVAVSGLREYLAELRVSLPVSRLAKWKTAAQMVALPFLIGNQVWLFFMPAGYVGVVLLWVAAILTVITGIDYWRASKEHLEA
ncbi:MAG: CDP-diacylglycerol--glycerol-3-phosphate 3-phosphatidyltransferase [Bdellovibrionales bacterium]